MPSKTQLKKRAGDLRKNLTPSEATLWSQLRRKQLGVKFRRQHVLFPYIVDFYCHSEKLVIEVDGGVHGSLASESADTKRDAELMERHGVVTVLRFSNREVVEELDDVVLRIEGVLEVS